jgi:hypothetical protein
MFEAFESWLSGVALSGVSTELLNFGPRSQWKYIRNHE